MNVTKQYVNELANGKSNPTLDTLYKLAGALDVRVVELLEDVQHPEGHELLCPHCGLPLEIIIEMPK
jgi:transcriptional regulator with XRE-family HTH domain